jgi:hypothetical protein
MNVKQYLKKNGYEATCVLEPDSIWTEVIVAFENSETGKLDETSFDISNPLTEAGRNELSDLFDVFCKENGLKANKVTAIIIAHMARTKDELEACA